MPTTVGQGRREVRPAPSILANNRASNIRERKLKDLDPFNPSLTNKLCFTLFVLESRSKFYESSMQKLKKEKRLRGTGHSRKEIPHPGHFSRKQYI